MIAPAVSDDVLTTVVTLRIRVEVFKVASLFLEEIFPGRENYFSTASRRSGLFDNVEQDDILYSGNAGNAVKRFLCIRRKIRWEQYFFEHGHHATIYSFSLSGKADGNWFR